MNKCFFRFFVLFQIFLFINNNLSDLTFDSSYSALLFDDTCIFVTENSNTIYKMKINDQRPQSLNITSNIKKKYLIKISNEGFILFGINNNNHLSHCTYNNINYNNLGQQTFFPTDIEISENNIYTIKYISENIFVVYYINSRQFNLYALYNTARIGGIKSIDLDNNYQLNNIECDSFDAINIFCVYTLIVIYGSQNLYYETNAYYSFENINQHSLGKNYIKANIGGPSLLKLEHENKKQFLICYYTINDGTNPSVYCQLFTQNENVIIAEQSYYIGTTSYSQLNYNNFYFQTSVQLLMYDYTIIIHLTFQQDEHNKKSIVFFASLDLKLIVPFYLNPQDTLEKKSILISGKYILFLTNTKIEIVPFETNCPSTTLYNLSNDKPKQNLTEITENSKSISKEDVYISFALDPSTYIYINNVKNPGGLLYMSKIKERNVSNSSINLALSENLKITYNYYIYHDKEIVTGANIKECVAYSNFCLLKVLHCYESCQTCNENITGTDEIHQCSLCKNNYYKFILNQNDKSFFNCYESDSSTIREHYFLDENDKQYYKCDDSCLTCNNNKTCLTCNDGYYFREDKILNELCLNSTPIEYYLDPIAKLYKKCYKTCSTCFGEGSEAENKCITCKSGLKKYSYDSTKCTDDINNCNTFWKINSTNNVQCIEQCDDFIILKGENKNQCVENCQTYMNPLNISQNNPLLFYTCDEQRYCITPNYCSLKLLKTDLTNCIRGKSCFEMDDTPATEEPQTTVIVIPTTQEIKETKTAEILKPISDKVTIVKYFEFRTKKFSEIENFTYFQIENYFSEYKIEINSHIYEDGIDFITVNTYEDFIITIYPLHKEEYLYKNVIKTNNLCFIDFNEFFSKIENVTIKNNIIIVGLIEFKNVNIPINSINYFFIECEEKNNSLVFNNYKEINKEDLNIDSSLKLYIEYPLYNFNNSNITEQYSLNLISTIKSLNTLDQNINFFSEANDFYSDICITFTSEEGTDMTISDRIETYSTKLSLCENGCENITSIIDKGKNENPRSVCKCDFKTTIEKSEDNYTFIYEKVEAKNVSNLNALKCANNVFSSKEIKNNLMFWIIIFIIFIFLVIFFVIVFCGKSSVEDILKIKKEEEEEKEEKEDNKDKNIYFDGSVKNLSANSQEKFQSIDVKDSSNNIKQKEIISSKMSYSQPPKKSKEITSTKPDRNNGLKTDNNSVNTTININNKIEFKFKNEDEDDYDEIFPDYNEVLNNNYYESKYMKNNYINLRLKTLQLKKYFSFPLGKKDYNKHNNTDNEDNQDKNKPPKNKRKRVTFNYFKTLLPNAEISENSLRNHYNKRELGTEYNENNKKNLKKNPNFLEDSDFIEDEDHNKTIPLKSKNIIKNTNELSNIENDKNNLYIHKGRKPSLTSSIKEKQSDISSIRSLNKSTSLNKYFLNSSTNNFNLKVHYSFWKFYWIYLNKREFCLTSIYNKQDNVASFIRIPTFLFVLLILFAINCLLLTPSQIHERHECKKNNKKINEFTYIFKKEIGTVFLLVLIYLIIKILFVKLIYGKLFKISYSAKHDLSPFKGHEEEEEKEEEEKKVDRNKKRKLYLIKYRRRSLIYIIIIFVLLIFIGYISICYFGIFKNTKIGLIIRFLIAFIFSIIFCALFCLIIVIIYHFGRKRKHNCMKSVYKCCDFIY